MTVRFQLQRLLSLSIASTSIAVFATASTHALAQAPVRQNPSQKIAAEQPPRERQLTKTISERADDEAPALGIMVGSCPGKAVCVKGTLPDSPAQEAGIVPGDYILSVNGQEVTSPGALKNLIAKMSPEAQVTLKIWRQGEEMERKVQLASKADQLPKCHDAWLGVMLASDGKGGTKIDRIVPGSPAHDSELEEGDTLVKVKDQNIKGAQEFVETIEEMGPGDELKLTIRRDGDEREVAVQLGCFNDAPMAFLRQLQPESDRSSFGGRDGSSASIELIDRALDDMRKQIRELRNEIRELKDEQKNKAAKPAAAAKQGDISDLFSPGEVKLVSQIQVQVPQRDNRQPNFNRPYNPNRNNYYNGQYGQHYSPYYGNGYQTPYGGNNYYYRQGGQPYYYGGNNNNWYGNRPRSGIQLGPNAGVYWY